MDELSGPGARQPGRTQSLYRKYRPMTFDEHELVGQDHISMTLRNAISRNRVAHAYLFCGPRGTGKTTTARLLAKAVNCLDPDPLARPCNQCDACLSINTGRATDIIEIDAASNRGIEDIRDLRERVKYAPVHLRHKFYIIDEAHRLTRDAFNAFLKTLEEPPPNTTFVLATTDPDELLETVASRCQRFDFHRIPADIMAARVRDVCELENIAIDDDALNIVVRHATGSMRDALSLVDMLATAAGEGGTGTIDADLTRRMLGLSQDERTLQLIEAIADEDMANGLMTIAQVVDSGQDMRSFGRQIIAALRLMLLIRGGADPAEADESIKQLAQRFEIEDLLRVNRQFAEVDFAIRNGGFPQLPIELAFVGSLVERPVSPRPVVLDRQPSATSANTAREMSDVRRPVPPSTNTPDDDRMHQATEPVTEVEDSDGPTLAYFIEHWPAVRTDVKARDRKIEALLASTDPALYSDNTLTLVAAYPFHAGKLNEQKVRSTIEAAILAIVGQEVRVTTVLKEEFDSQPEPPTPIRPRPATTPVSNGHAASAPVVSDQEVAAEQQSNGGRSEAKPSGNFDQEVERLKALFDAEEIDPEESADALERGD